MIYDKTLVDTLVKIYLINVAAAAAVAIVCNEHLDRSGILLDHVRAAAKQVYFTK